MADQPARFAFVCDAPDLTAAHFPDGAPDDVPAEAEPPRSTIQVAKTGRFNHPRYGRFQITRQTFERMIANFRAGVPTDRLPMDFDHEPDFGGPSRAVGWIVALRADGEQLLADVEWTWPGAFAIREREYRYISPTWVLDYVDDTGAKHGPTLLAAALTNRPFFQRMAAVSLSQSFSQVAPDGFAAIEEDPDEQTFDVPGAASDSRARMADLANIAQVFGLPADADEDAILTAAKAAQDKATAEPEPQKPLEELAEAQGFSLVKSDQFQALTEQVQTLRSTLADRDFAEAFSSALTAGKVDAKDETREMWRAQFDAAPDQTLKLLAALQPIVNTAAKGSGEGDDEVPEGHDPERYRLDKQVQNFMAEHQVDYPTALSRVLAQQEAAA